MNQQAQRPGLAPGKRQLPGSGWPRGALEQKTVFIIICVVAIAIAAVAIGSHFLGGGAGGIGSRDNWQCLKCDHTFFDATLDPSPIECPKCGGDAVKLGYRTCAECKKKILVSRSRLREDAAAAYRQRKAQGQAPMPMEMMAWPRDVQWRVQQADGSYGWTEWMPRNSAEDRQVRETIKCPKCGANLYKYRTPSR